MIKEFQNEYRWLSNFYPCKVIFEGVEYISVEHAYQSAKSKDSVWKKFCRDTIKPGLIKIESKKIEVDRNVWDEQKIKVMKILIDQKFNQEPFKTKLLETKDQIIQEGNRWGDTFWGVDLKTGNGKNILGKLIMKKRDQLNFKSW